MTVSVFCEHCRRELKLPEEAIGKRGRCPACRNVFVAALPTATPVDAPSGEPLEGEAAFAEAVAEVDEKRTKKPRKVRPAAQGFLRFTVLLTALVGAAACGAVYYLWQREQAEMGGIVALARAVAPDNAKLDKELEQFDAHGRTYPYMLAATFAALLGGLLCALRYGVVGGLMMVAGAIVPAILFPPSLLFTAALIVAGGLALMIQSHSRAQRNAELAEKSQKRYPRLQHPLVTGAAIL